MPPARVPATQSERKRLLTRQKHRGVGVGLAGWKQRTGASPVAGTHRLRPSPRRRKSSRRTAVEPPQREASAVGGRTPGSWDEPWKISGG